MGTPLVMEVIQRPATSFLIAVLMLVWMYLHREGLSYADVGMSYDLVCNQAQLWRVFSAQFSHIDFLHLLFNGSALWSLGVIEKSYGSLYFLQISFLLLVSCGLVVMALYWVAITVFRREQYAKQHAIGFSCVVFALMTIVAVQQPGGHSSYSILGLSVSAHCIPFGSLVLTSVLIPRASFLGHLAGIIVGYAAAFGAFAWMTPFWTVSLGLWAVLGVVWSLMRHDSMWLSSIPYIGMTGSAIAAEDIELGSIWRRPPPPEAVPQA